MTTGSSFAGISFLPGKTATLSQAAAAITFSCQDMRKEHAIPSGLCAAEAACRSAARKMLRSMSAAWPQQRCSMACHGGPAADFRFDSASGKGKKQGEKTVAPPSFKSGIQVWR
jgi:hypothetical protein